MIKFKKNNGAATIPKRHSEGAAGFDLCSIESGVVFPGHTAIFDTGIAVSVPSGYMGQVSPRSGLAFKHGVVCVSGVVDSDYTGSIKVMLVNHGHERLIVEKGMRVAQLVIHRILTDFEVVDKLEETERGSKGFGSTGVK